MKIRVLRSGRRWAAVCTHNGKLVDASLGVDETTDDAIIVVQDAERVLLHLVKGPS